MALSNVVLLRLIDANAIVGVVEERTPDAWMLSHMAVLRRWGTTAGFPELVRGPTSDTILDIARDLPPGVQIEVPRDKVIYAIPAQDRPWFDALGIG